jgi:hypothetical protein
LFVLEIVAGPFMGSVFQEKNKVLLHLNGEMMGENQQVHYEENSKIGILYLLCLGILYLFY